jgi:hypothetical protein
MRLAIAAALCLALAAPAMAQTPPLKMDAATQQRLGLVTAPLQAARRTAGVAAFARVMDVTPLATLQSDLLAAAAALSASQAEASRAKALNAADQALSQRALDAAQAQARADAAKLGLLRRRIGLEWGPALAAQSDAARDRLVADIAAGRAALVRVDASGVALPARGSVTLDVPGATPIQAVVLGPARAADPRLQSAGVLALVRGPAATSLASGMVMPAKVAGAGPRAGVIVPRSALLRTGGQTVAYVRKSSDTFERRDVVGGLADPAGMFVAGGFAAGEAVVVSGAAKLFAAQAPKVEVD